MVENVIYPAYLDSELSRGQGRRVPKGMAVPEPTVDEIANAIQQVGYDTIIERSQSYSREPWRERGRVIVKDADDSAKNDLVQATAAYVQALRD